MQAPVEGVDVAISPDRHDPDCYFCNATEEVEPENNETADSPEGDELQGYVIDGKVHVNSSGKLTRNMIGTDKSKIPTGEAVVKWTEDTTDYEEAFGILTAAHHLIPGNGSLAGKESSDLVKNGWLGSKQGIKKGNIGYDVNCAQNGLFLPGNYQIRRSKGARKTWSAVDPAFQLKYAFAAIERMGAQFHDAHEKYNEHVKAKLNEIAQKLEEIQEQPWCPKSKPPEDGDPRPLYSIVNRLHKLSGEMEQFLIYPEDKWKQSVYTSKFSQLYMKRDKGAG